jgi:hypothetical protein
MSATISRPATILGFFIAISSSLDVTDSIREGIDDFDILDVRDSIFDIAEIFHVVPEAVIMLLLDCLQDFYCRWTLIRALEVADEHGT